MNIIIKYSTGCLISSNTAKGNTQTANLDITVDIIKVFLLCPKNLFTDFVKICKKNPAVGNTDTIDIKNGLKLKYIARLNITKPCIPT